MATTEATEKPAYLGLLNAISLAESHAGQYLEAWANVTDDEDLACCLRLVAARERSHGEVFCRRIAELGDAPAEDLAVAALTRRHQAQAAGQVLVVGDVGPGLQVLAGVALGERDGVQQAEIRRLLGGFGRGHGSASSITGFRQDRRADYKLISSISFT